MNAALTTTSNAIIRISEYDSTALYDSQQGNIQLILPPTLSVCANLSLAYLTPAKDLLYGFVVLTQCLVRDVNLCQSCQTRSSIVSGVLRNLWPVLLHWCQVSGVVPGTQNRIERVGLTQWATTASHINTCANLH